MKRSILILALGLSGLLPAQTSKLRNNPVIDLQQQYDLWPSDGKLLVQDVFDLAKAKTIYPSCFAAWEREKMAGGMTKAQADTWIMGMTLFEAAYFDALWTNASWSINPSATQRGNCFSRNKILIPAGSYYTRDKLDYAFNDISGVSNSSNYEPTGEGGTVLNLWQDQWRGNDTDRVLMGFHDDGSSGLYSYAESLQIYNLRFDGHAASWKDPKRTTTGLRAWSVGSGSNIRNIFVRKCDIGIDAVGGTPFTGSGYIGVFECNVAGVALSGGAGATISFNTLESDDCPTLFLICKGPQGQAAGAMLNVRTTKIEWAITPPGMRTAKPEAIVVGEGWLHLNFGSISYAAGDGCIDALFNLNPNVNASFLHVGDLRGWGGDNIKAILHDDKAKKTWLYDNSWSSKINTFDWANGVQPNSLAFRSWPGEAIAVDAPHQGRLGGLPKDPTTGQCIGTFDRINGTPEWSDITGNSAPSSDMRTGTVRGPQEKASMKQDPLREQHLFNSEYFVVATKRCRVHLKAGQLAPAALDDHGSAILDKGDTLRGGSYSTEEMWDDPLKHVEVTATGPNGKRALRVKRVDMVQVAEDHRRYYVIVGK